jgi:putative membrane protein insertion efficiency factor
MPLKTGPDACREGVEMKGISVFLKRLPRKLAIICITIYRRAISPLLPPSCRFTPTCSEYALTAIQSFGVVKGGWLAAKRILRCNPWHPGGYDPVQPN